MDNKAEIRSNVFSYFQGFEFADDVYLISKKENNPCKRKLKKTTKVPLEINVKKSKIRKINTERQL